MLSTSSKEKTGNDPLEVFEKAMENIMPVSKSRPAASAALTYQVPMEVRPERRQTLGLRWLTAYSRARGEKTMKERLWLRDHGCRQQRWRPLKKREDTHKMAEANKAFAHFAGNFVRQRRIMAMPREVSLEEDQKYRYHGAHRRR